MPNSPLPPPSGAGVARSDVRVDHALSLLLAEQPEAALQWAAAVVEREPLMASALVVTSRLLEQLGRRRAALDGYSQAIDRAVAAGDLPLAMAAIGDLRRLGVEVDSYLDRVAHAFCLGSSRLQEGPSTGAIPGDDFQPLSPFLTGPALASRASQILQGTSAAGEAVEPRPVAALPLFSALPREALRELLSAFQTVTVPAGQRVVQEGSEEAAVYVVASGELEVSRAGAGDRASIALGRLGPGSFFGDTELLSGAPRSASLTATRPSILLVAKREALDAVASRRPEVAAELNAHCRRRVVESLGRASPLLHDVPATVRQTLIERFETRSFRKGEKIVRDGEEPNGLHLVVSGEVVVVAHEAGEPVLLATLAAGETVGEVELILCRTARADAIAAHPTATLFLPRWEFFTLVQEHPALLPGMYMAAVRRHAEAKLALEAATIVVTDEPTAPLPVSAEPAERSQPVSSPTPEQDRVAAEMAAQIESTAFPPPIEATPVAATVSTSKSLPPTSATVRPVTKRAPPPQSTRWIAAGSGIVLAAAAVALAFGAIQGRRVGAETPAAAASGAADSPSQKAATAREARSTAELAAPAAVATSTPSPAPAGPAKSLLRTVPARPRSATAARGAVPAVATAAVVSPALAGAPAAPAATPAPDAGQATSSLSRAPEEFGGRN